MSKTAKLDPEAWLAEAMVNCQIVERVTLTHEWMPATHIGIADKIYYIENGGGHLVLENELYTLHPGQAFIIPTSLDQRGEIDQQHGLQKIWTHFSVVAMQSLYLLMLHPPPRCLSGETGKQIGKLMRQMLDEWTDAKPGHHLAIKSLIMQVIVTAYRAPEEDIVKPDELVAKSSSPIPSPADEHYKAIRDVLNLMAEHYMAPWTLAEFAAHVELSPNYFNTLFRRVIGLPPMRFLESLRLRHARTLLGGTQMHITEIAPQVGYQDAAYFTRVFTKQTGQSPTAYRISIQSNRRMIH
jgi:AraC-like DNA-binding protein